MNGLYYSSIGIVYAAWLAFGYCEYVYAQVLGSSTRMEFSWVEYCN